VFVGLDAYEAAGGEILRDLFSADDGGWLQDAVLLDHLAAEKLQSVAEALGSEGWKWIEVLPSLPFDHLHGLRKIEPVVSGLGDEDNAALILLKAEYDNLTEAFAEFEELPDTADQRMAELDAAIEALKGNAEASFDPAEVARAGAVVSIGRNGHAEILRGFIRPEDEQVAEVETMEPGQGKGVVGDETVRQTAIISLGGAGPVPQAQTEEDEGDTLRPLPEKLILELTAFRTIALRDAVARHPHVAMTLLLHKLVSDIFSFRVGGSCLGANVFLPTLHNIAPKGLDESIPASSMDRRKALWAEAIPSDDQRLWDWLNDQTDEVRSELLAFCVSYGVNAISERVNAYGAVSQHSIDTRLKHADRVAEATALDLVGIGWRPTADSYLNRVPRPRILEAVREGCGERAAQMIDHLKKADMVAEAERLLADSGPLPEPLRGPEQTAEAREAEMTALPAFLDDGAELAVYGKPAPIGAE